MREGRGSEEGEGQLTITQAVHDIHTMGSKSWNDYPQ